MNVRLTAAVLAFCVLPLSAAFSADPNTKVRFDLDRQPLEAALVELSKQGQLQLVIATGSLPAKIVEPLHGNMSLGLALDRLLSDTGLTYKLVGDHTIAIVKSAEPGQSSDPPKLPGASGAPTSDATNIDYRIVDQGAQDTKKNWGDRSVNHQSAMLRRLASFLGLCISGAATYPACAADDSSGAQAQLEEIIVTAERRTSDVQNTAASVSVRSGEELAAQGRYTTRQILEDIPGLVAVENNSLNVGSADVQGNNITIRGITPGTSAGGGPSQIAAAPGAAVYVDGVYEGAGSGYDIERVEVLRGPQGTLYGRSATTGVVAFHTRNPSMDGFGGNAAVEFGNYNLQHYTAAVNIPLTDTLAMRVSGDYRDQGDGYYGNAQRGMIQRTQGRAKLLWEPNDAFSLLMGFAYDKNDGFSGGQTRTVATPNLDLTINSSAILPSHKVQRQYWVEANLDVGPVTITYLPAFRTWEQHDHLFTSANFLSSGFPQNQKINTPTDNFHTQELRVSSGEDSAIQWLAGVFYYDNKLRTANRNYLVTPSGGEQSVLSDTNDRKDTTNLGYFAETTIPLTNSLRMTLGVRYDDTQVLVSEFLFDNEYGRCGTSSQGNVTLPPGVVCTGAGQASAPPLPGVTISGVELNFHNFNYKARIEYDLTPKNMVYGMISTGFRPGDAGIASRALNIVAAEKLTSIEVGSKNRFLDDSLQLNVGLFHYNYQGFRTSYRRDTAGAFDFTGQGSAISLTVPAKNFGGELELLYQLTANDRIGLNYNYVESRWKDKPAEFAAAQPETKRAMTPYTISANYQHVFDLPGGSTLSARIDGRYEAAHLERDLHADYLRLGYDQYVYLSARTFGNLSAAWASDGGRYLVSAYLRNFTDKQYATNEVRADRFRFTQNLTDPRTYGAMASVRF